MPTFSPIYLAFSSICCSDRLRNFGTNIFSIRQKILGGHETFEIKKKNVFQQCEKQIISTVVKAEIKIKILIKSVAI